MIHSNENSPVPGRLVLVRHAQSRWNVEQRFTGWADVVLTAAGIAQARAAGSALAQAAIPVDMAFVSRLQRAADTLAHIQEQSGLQSIPVTTAWELNERHYGGLQGVDKREAAARFGALQVNRWRRGYADRPPQVLRSDPAHPVHDPRYADVNPDYLPSGESLQETRHRVVEYFRRRIRPQLLAGNTVLVVSHGNTLRALVMELEMLTVAEVEQLEIPMSTPVCYSFDADFELAGKQSLAPSGITGREHVAA